MSDLDNEEIEATRELNKNKYKNCEIFYDRKYLQQPISILTKESLEILEECCIRSRKRDIGRRFREHEIVLELIYRYKELQKQNEKKDEMIDYIIEFIRERSIYAIDSHEQLKQYFERKVEEK